LTFVSFNVVLIQIRKITLHQDRLLEEDSRKKYEQPKISLSQVELEKKARSYDT